MRKNKKIWVFLGILLVVMSFFFKLGVVNVEDKVIGDDYFVKWKNLFLGVIIDDWGMVIRYCIFFVVN